MDEFKMRSGQIPAFGDWERANDLPITQYFECARQAGLVRFNKFSGECCGNNDPYHFNGQSHDLYGNHHHDYRDFKKSSQNLGPRNKARLREKRGPHVNNYGNKDQKNQNRKVCDVADPLKKHHQLKTTSTNYVCDVKDGAVSAPQRRPSKAVDEDLYQIPPELLRSSKQKKMPGFFSCLVPACGS